MTLFEAQLAETAAALQRGCPVPALPLTSAFGKATDRPWGSLASLLRRRLQAGTPGLRLARRCALFGSCSIQSILNSFPTFQMGEISNENPDFWLLLKYQKIWHPGRTCSVRALARGCKQGLAAGEGGGVCALEGGSLRRPAAPSAGFVVCDARRRPRAFGLTI